MKLPDDPFVLELLPEFVDTWICDIDEQYSKFVDEHNSQELYRLAHTLKGSCFQFGLDDIANLGIELMGYAKVGNWEKARTLKEPIRNLFVEMRNFLVEKGIIQ